MKKAKYKVGQTVCHNGVKYLINEIERRGIIWHYRQKPDAGWVEEKELKRTKPN